MPRIETDPGTELREVWVYLSDEEAEELRLALAARANEDEPRQPGWHTHILDSEGREVTIAVGDSDSPG
jgi:hypothetical protein